MKVIIAGSRSIDDYEIVEDVVLDAGFNISEVVIGMADGVDILGLRYAIENGIPFKKFPITKMTGRLKAGQRGLLEIDRWVIMLIH